MKLLVPGTSGLAEDRGAARSRIVLQEFVAGRHPTFPVGGDAVAADGWLSKSRAMVDDGLLAAIAACDYVQAPRLLSRLHAQGRLTSDAYRLVARTFLQAGPGAVGSIGATRWKTLLRQRGFHLHDHTAPSPTGTTLLYRASTMPGSGTLLTMTPNLALAAAYAGLPGADGEVWCLAASPRRVMAALSPSVALECGWGCTSIHILVDTDKVDLLLHVPGDAVSDDRPCACEAPGPQISSWTGAVSVVTVPLPVAVG